MLVTRAAVLVAGAIAAGIAWTTPDTVFTAIAFAWGGLGTTFIAPLVLGLWWDRANGPGAIVGLLIGFFGGAIWSQVLSGGPNLGGRQLFNVYFVIPVLILSFTGQIIVTLLTEPPKDEVTDQIRRISTPMDEEAVALSGGGSGSPGPAATDGGTADSDPVTDSIALTRETVVTEYTRTRSLSDLPSADAV